MGMATVTTRPNGVVISVVDTGNWYSRNFYWDEVEVKSLKEMAYKVYDRVGNKKKIGVLNIGDHGNTHSFQIGDQVINNGNITVACEWFKEMAPMFSPDGYVHMQHCNIGMASYLLTPAAKAFGVRVFAGTGRYNFALRTYMGGMITCHFPNGMKMTDVGGLPEPIKPEGPSPTPSPGPSPAP